MSGKKEEEFFCLWDNSPYINMLTCEKSQEQTLFTERDPQLILSSPLLICGKHRGDSGNSRMSDFWSFLSKCTTTVSKISGLFPQFKLFLTGHRYFLSVPFLRLVNWPFRWFEEVLLASRKTCTKIIYNIQFTTKSKNHLCILFVVSILSSDFFPPKSQPVVF